MLPTLVLDANILIRAVLGNKVKQYLITYNGVVEFFIPDICVKEAKKYLPIVFDKRGMPYSSAVEVLSDIESLLQIVDKSIYQERALEAQKRIEKRDIDDWPVVATALVLNCPVWTEDQDFFGSGLSVWTTDRIHLFFESLI